jgi:hypothetical protein
MLDKRSVNKLIDALCSMIGSEPVQLNDENVCAFRYKKESHELDVTLYYSKENGLITLLSILTHLTFDSDRDLAILKSLLSVCFPGFISKGSTISINPYENTVVLTYQLPTEVDAYLLYKVFKNFIDTALIFIEHIEKTERLINQKDQLGIQHSKLGASQHHLLSNRNLSGLHR